MRLHIRSLSIALVITSITAASVLGQIRIDPTTATRIDSALIALVEENAIVGLQVAIGMEGSLAWTGAYGMADLEHDSPVTDETLFRTGSISKWLTATAAMRLVELGQLNLDAPVQVYCPEYPEKRWALTSRHLLGHRGGVRHYWGFNGEPRDTPEQRRELRENSDEERLWMSVRYTDVLEPVHRFKDDPLLFEPGSDFSYSSHGYRLLGCVLQGAANAPYSTVMQEHVFGPAGMSSTQNDDAYAIIPGRARGYTLTPEGDLRRSSFRDVSENLPAGGHVSTAADLVRFALAWHAERLVGWASVEAMTARPEGVAASEAYYGFGISVRELGEDRMVRHGGSQDGTRTMLILRSDTGRAIAWMTNYERIPSDFDFLILSTILGLLRDR